MANTEFLEETNDSENGGMMKKRLLRLSAHCLLVFFLTACSTAVVFKRTGVTLVSQKLPKDTPVIWVVPDDVDFYMKRTIPKWTIPPNSGIPPVSPELNQKSTQFFRTAFLTFNANVKSQLAAKVRAEGSISNPEVFLVVSPVRGIYDAVDHKNGMLIETTIKDRKTAQNIWSVRITVLNATNGDDPQLWDRYFELLLSELRKTGWL